ncbi:MAG TPA: MBL fold metallo-hydrolase [Candidatus Latescibacteria bacterium]|nr:MBL fold metallo-hydrolase [Candidatus Latescibacterota bacterium]
MNLIWLGHAAFLIVSLSGQRILTDPYQSGAFGGAIGYKAIEDTVDVVTVSHEHLDHNYTKGLPGRPLVVKGPGMHQASGFTFKGVPSYHDEHRGRDRGTNTIFVFEVDSLRICHLGDLGHTLSKEQIDAIGEVDVLLIPVGGYYTIDADKASQVVKQLSPKLVVPMHFKTKSVRLPIAPVDEFIKGKKDVECLDSSEITITRGALPEQTRIVVLKHRL